MVMENLRYHFTVELFSHKTAITAYYAFTSLIVGSGIASFNNIAVIDGFFIATSAMTSSGLNTIPMSSFNKGSFGLISILMVFGNSIFMLLPPMIIRKITFRRLKKKIFQSIRLDKSINEDTYFHRLPIKDRKIIKGYQIVDDALTVVITVVVMYYIFFVMCGMLVLFGALYPPDQQQEVRERGYTTIENAAFLSISAFANCGLTISTDSLLGLNDNPGAYITIAILIFAGNTAAPIFLRLVFEMLMVIEEWREYYFPTRNTTTTRRRFSVTDNTPSLSRYQNALKLCLKHPRKLTTHLLTRQQTKILTMIVLLLIITQYIFFLSAELTKTELIRKYSRATLAGMGFFQTTSTRAAGFMIIDLRELGEGLLVIYAIMMYVSSFPFVTTLHSTSEEEIDEPSETITSTSLVATNEFSALINPAATTTSDNSNQETVEQEQSNQSTIIDTDNTKDIEAEDTKDSTITETDQKDTEEPPMTSNQVNSTMIVMKGRCNTSSTSAISLASEPTDQLTVKIPPTELTATSPTTTTSPSSPLRMLTSRAPSYNDTDRIIHAPRQNSAPMIIYNHITEVNNKFKEDEASAFAKRFLFRHTFVLISAVIILAFSEEKLLSDVKYGVNLWYIIFEVISAYGSVGLSLGILGETYSLTGGMTILGKLVIIAVMLLGKHRGLPRKGDDVIDYTFLEYQRAWQYQEQREKNESLMTSEDLSGISLITAVRKDSEENRRRINTTLSGILQGYVDV